MIVINQSLVDTTDSFKFKPEVGMRKLRQAIVICIDIKDHD